MAFWDTPQHGGNSFNRLPPTQEYYDALRGYGATWVRLSYDKWKPAGRDFLLGNADGYRGLEATDLATLKDAIRKAHAAGLKVVIAPFLYRACAGRKITITSLMTASGRTKILAGSGSVLA